MTVEKGKEYTVRTYVHNNAAENLNLVAENVTLKFNLPTTTGKHIEVDGFLSASNVRLTEVYYQAIFKTGLSTESMIPELCSAGRIQEWEWEIVIIPRNAWTSAERIY